MTSKEEYLKKYLCGGSNESKKKKRSDQSRVKIYDDDIDVKSLLPKNIKNTLDEDIGDDKPSVADVVDERPRDVVELEKFRQSKHWKIVGSSDSKGNDGNRTATTTQNSASRGSVASPLRDKGSGSNDVSNKHRRHDSDSDVSPPRKRSLSPKVASLSTSRASSKYVSSPVSDRANPPRQISRHDSPLQQRHRHDSESSDLSPQRTTSCDGYVPKRSRHDSDSDSSDRKKRRHDSDSDNSPARRSRPVVDSQRLSNQGTGDDVALLKQNNRHNSDSDSSPKRSSKMRSVPDSHLAKKGVVSDFDLSPSRQNIIRENPRSRKDVQATNRLSRPEIVPKVIMSDRRDNKSHTSTRQSTRDVDASDTDLSPRRRQRHHDSSPHRSKRLLDDDDGDLSPVRKSDSDKLSNSYKASKTLSGATAGLQSAEDMKREARELKRKEEESFSRLPDEILGKNAAAVIRGRQLAKQSKQAEEKAAKDAAAEKYKVWNQGVKQQELRAQQVEDAIHESEKPLSRYRDDVDLDAKLREQDRAGDPMLAYIKKKKIKSQEPAKPRYTGPEPPPNRFNIWPGYRWDGVDRSNGFERQYFASLSNKKAIKDISYKWSVEDM